MVSRLSLLCAIFVTGCAACPADTWTKPIYPSRHDALTRGTAEQILIHNETWEKVNAGS